MLFLKGYAENAAGDLSSSRGLVRTAMGERLFHAFVKVLPGFSAICDTLRCK
jgi:hypothetical protein